MVYSPVLRFRRAARTLFLVIAFSSLASPAVYAQAVYGSISGVIADSQGAVMPGVTVTASSPALITPQTTITTATGSYRFPNIPIGVYSVTFELS